MDGKEGEELINFLLESSKYLKANLVCKDKKQILKKYKEEFLRKKHVLSDNTCKMCGGSIDKGSCISCGAVDNGLYLSVAYSDMETHNNFVGKHRYKRVTRWQDFLRQLQGKTMTNIDDKVIEEMKKYCRIKRRRLDEFGPFECRQGLKERKLTRYNEGYIHITSQVNAKYTKLVISLDRVKIMNEMFKKIDRVWDEIKENRRNFFSYHYLGFKIFELFGWEEYCHYIKLPKTQKLVDNLDKKWYRVCKILHLPFKITNAS